METIYECVVGESMDVALEQGMDGRLLAPRGVEMEKGIFLEAGEKLEMGLTSSSGVLGWRRGGGRVGDGVCGGGGREDGGDGRERRGV